MNGSFLGTASFPLKNYWIITKPGIIFGNLITGVGGFLIASKGDINALLFLATFAGLACIIAAACVGNNCIDHKLDQKMERTKYRPLATGALSLKKALIFAFFLLAIGSFLLMTYVNFLSCALAWAGLGIYLAIYSLFKTKNRFSTLLGSVAGAMPPLVGYAAVTRNLDIKALFFFLLMIFWQMPHFLAIAIYRLKDYQSASIPLLPLEKGILATKWHMLFYIAGFMGISALLLISCEANLGYLVFMELLGACWFFLALWGFKAQEDTLWAKKMFFASLVVIMTFCLGLPLGL